jgi:hypothetical protein
MDCITYQNKNIGRLSKGLQAGLWLETKEETVRTKDLKRE